MSKISIAGLEVNTETTAEIIQQIKQRMGSDKKTFIVTPYSEFLYAGMLNKSTMELLNRADISIPDGIAILLARTYLEKPQPAKNHFLRIVIGWWHMFWLGWMLLLFPKKVYGPFAGKIVGANFVWDLVDLAAKENKSIYILGGHGNTPEVAGQKMLERYPTLKIVGQSNKMKNDPSILEDIQKAKPDFLLVGFGPITQEKWIYDNWDNLPVKLAIGLGGTFDYIAGDKTPPPQWIRQVGLEWLYRLFTQPARAGRIKNGTFGLVNALIKYKASL